MRKKRLKILVFNRWVGYNQGGNETHTKELAVFLNINGHRIDILTTGHEALKDIRKHINKVIEIDSPREHFMYGMRSLLFTLKYMIGSIQCFDRLVRIERRKYDLVITSFSLEAFIMRFVRLIYKLPYVLIMVGDTDLELIEGKRADRSSQLTHYAAKECAVYGYYPDVLTKGIDRSRFNLNIKAGEIRRKYTERGNQFLVITVCRLEPRKNIATLINAANILEKKHKGIFKFVIVGGGVEELMLRNMAKRYKLDGIVHFTGMLSSTSDLLIKHYAAADIFAMPSLHEGYGYVFTEAMAFGLPVIGTRTSSIPEVVEDVGLVVPIKSPVKLAQAIHLFYKDKKLYQESKRKGLRKVEDLYWDKLIEKYEKYLWRGVEHFNKRRSLNKRLVDFMLGIILDAPLIIFFGFHTIFMPKDTWGSIFRKE